MQRLSKTEQYWVKVVAIMSANATVKVTVRARVRVLPLRTYFSYGILAGAFTLVVLNMLKVNTGWHF